MSRKRKARRSIPRMLLLWAGRRMLGRVQKRSLRSITQRPKPKRLRMPALPGRTHATAPEPKRLPRLPRLPRKSAVGSTVAPAAVPTNPRRRVNRAKAGKGIAAAVFTTAAVAALKFGADRVIEAERSQHVVTPDFDVFSDDDE